MYQYHQVVLHRAALKPFITHQGEIRGEKVNMLKYRAAIQKELDRLEGRANRSPMKFIKDKCKVQHLGRKTSLQQYSLGTGWPGSVSAKRDLGSCGQQAGHEPCQQR